MSKDISMNSMQLRMAIRGRDQSAINPSNKTFDWSARIYRPSTSRRLKDKNHG